MFREIGLGVTSSIRKRLGVGLASLAATAGLIIATPQASHAVITTVTEATDCSSPDPSDTTGTIRIYLTYQRDTAPNPDKVRLVYFVIQNRFNHTMRVESPVYHYIQSGNNDWWTNDDVVLTTSAGSPEHQVGNYDNGTHSLNGPGALPWREAWEGGQGIFNSLNRPQWDTADVGTYSPLHHPWWNSITNTGPYLWVPYYVQGDYSACTAWYPK